MGTGLALNAFGGLPLLPLLVEGGIDVLKVGQKPCFFAFVCKGFLLAHPQVPLLEVKKPTRHAAVHTVLE